MCRPQNPPILSFPSLLFFFFLFLTISTAVTSLERPGVSLPLPNHIVYQFPNGTWLNNLAIRSNGEVLVTVISRPELYLIDTVKRSATFIHSFPAVLSVAGITEVEHDRFYLVAGNVTPPTRAKSFSVWEVDLRNFSLKSGARIRKVTDTPNAISLNGVTTLSKEDRTILISDSVLGAAWILNVETGAYSVAISEPTMAPDPTAKLQNGINGVKVRDGHLYYTNTNQGLICKVPISCAGNATGPVEVLATGIAPDDFDLDRKGRPWISQIRANVVSVLLQNGTVVDVVGAKDQLTVAGVNSCVFGRLPKHSDLLYCTTSGGIAAPVNGTIIEGGKLVVIDTKGF